MHRSGSSRQREVMFKAIRSHKFYVPLLTIAGCAGLFLVYYFFYVSWQRNYTNERAFRLLSVVGDQFMKRHANVSKVLGAALAYHSGQRQGMPVREDDPKKYLETYMKNASDVQSGGTCPKVEKVSKEREGDLSLDRDETRGGYAFKAMFKRT